MKLIVKDICHTVVGQTINEVDIYKYQGNDIPVYSSGTINKGLMGKISQEHIDKFVSHGNGGNLTWNTNGYAGRIFLREHDFLMSEKCGKLIIKDEYKEKINPKWLEIYLNTMTSQAVRSKGGNGKLEKSQLDNIQIEILPIEEQIKIANEYLKRIAFINKLEYMKKELEEQISKIVSIDSGEEYKISDIFNVISGVRITEKQIYKNRGDIPCITSKTRDEGIAWRGSREWLSKIKKNDKPLLINENCLTWTKDGINAGTMFYRDYEFYPNDHCGVLIPKIKINLKWFLYNYQKLIYSKVAFKDSQGMLYDEVMSNIKVRIPNIEVQNTIAKEYLKLKGASDKLNIILKKYSV